MFNMNNIQLLSLTIFIILCVVLWFLKTIGFFENKEKRYKRALKKAFQEYYETLPENLKDEGNKNG